MGAQRNSPREPWREELITNNMGLVYDCAKKFANGKWRSHFEDLQGEGFKALTKAADAFDTARGNKFSTYAHTCISNEMRGYLRKQKQVRENEQLVADEYFEGYESTDRTDYESETEAAMEELCKPLNDQERKVVTLRFGACDDDDLAFREIAARMKMATSTVSTIYYRAHEKMLDYASRHPEVDARLIDRSPPAQGVNAKKYSTGRVQRCQADDEQDHPRF